MDSLQIENDYYAPIEIAKRQRERLEKAVDKLRELGYKVEIKSLDMGSGRLIFNVTIE